MNSTPIHPNDFLTEGAYVGNIIDFIKECVSYTHIRKNTYFIYNHPLYTIILL